MQQETQWDDSRARSIIHRHVLRPGPLLPILHDLQEAFGHIPVDAVPVLAAALNLSRAEIHGVITFYHDFHRTPPGRKIVKLCQAEACQAMGSRDLADHARARLGVAFGGTTADGAVTLQAVYCLGLCATAPAAQIGEQVFGRLTAHKLDLVLGAL